MKKNFKIIMIILGILLVIFVILLIYVSKNQANTDAQVETQELREEAIEEYYSDKILPQNVSSLYANYKGSNDRNDLYKAISNMINYLPKVCDVAQDMDDSQIQKYFSDNSVKIKNAFGITEVDEFIKLVQYLKTKNIEPNQYQYCAIISNSYAQEDEGEYTSFDMKIVYENTDMTFRVYFANSTYTRPKTMFLSK